MYAMFQNTNFNQNINSWNVENVTDMSFMFYKANLFNNGNVALNWGEKTINVTNMSYMFAAGLDDDINATSNFNQNIGDWNVSNVEDMNRMFLRATSFNNGNQPMVWNTNKVKNMVKMFYNCQNLNQNLGNWDISSIGTNTSTIASMEEMFTGVKMSISNFENTLLGWDNFVQNNNIPLNVNLGAGDNKYCDTGRYALNHLQNKGWNINFSNNGGLELYSICDPNKFVLTVNVSANESITIPTDTNLTYNYKIYWGDETSEENVTGNITHTYSESGTYPVKISGDFPRINFSLSEASSTRNKVLFIENWGSMQWESMENAFWSCTNLKIKDSALPPDLSMVTNASNMFYQCSKLNDKGNLNSWNVSTITNMNRMFRNAGNFNQDISNWDVNNVTTMNAMFSNASRFNNGGNPLNWGLKTKNVTDFTQMFHNTLYFDQPINDWDVSSAILMTSMFSGSKFNKPLNNWDVKNVTKMDNMFSLNRNFNQNLNSWDVSSVTNMYWMFKEADDYNNGEEPLNWGSNTSSVINMEGMFSSAGNFNQPINWDVSKVENMKDMFWNASKFNQDVSNWDVSSVTNMHSMFFRAYDFNNGEEPLDWGLKTQNVTSTAQMFYEIQNFNQPLNIDVSSVTNMDSMFKGCTNFNQDISNWNVANVIHMTSVFFDATSFNQDISNWNVSNVQQMQNLFRNATSFNQNLENWYVSNVIFMNNMFKGATLTTDNYDALLASWSQRITPGGGNFHAGNSKYCNQTARDEWEAKGWTITDDGQDTNCSLSIEDEYKTKINIYPNPFSSTAKIKLNNYSSNIIINLYNIQGKLVKQFKNINNNSLEINRIGLTNGIYLLHIIDKNKTYKMEKIIIN